MPRISLGWLALVAFLAAPAGAAEDMKIEGKNEPAEPKAKIMGVKLQVLDCDDPADAALLEQYVQDAVPLVECLAGVNPGIAKKIGANFKKFVFHCGRWSSGTGATTVHTVNEKGRLKRVDITYNFGAGGTQYLGPARIYHELIHAIDVPEGPGSKHPDGRLVTTTKQHAKAGFPDAVYGCHFACDQGRMGDDENKMIGNVMDALKSDGVDIHKDKDFKCSWPDKCGVVEFYAGVCRKGEPLLPESWKNEARRKDRPKCLLEVMLNACPLGKTEMKRKANCEKPVIQQSALCRLRCEYDAAGDDEDKIAAVETKAARGAANLAKVLDQNGEGLAGDDAHYYHELEMWDKLKLCR